MNLKALALTTTLALGGIFLFDAGTSRIEAATSTPTPVVQTSDEPMTPGPDCDPEIAQIVRRTRKAGGLKFVTYVAIDGDGNEGIVVEVDHDPTPVRGWVVLGNPAKVYFVDIK